MKGNSVSRPGTRTVSAVNIEVKIEFGHFHKGNLRMHTKAFCTGRSTSLLARNIHNVSQATTRPQKICAYGYACLYASDAGQLVEQGQRNSQLASHLDLVDAYLEFAGP